MNYLHRIRAHIDDDGIYGVFRAIWYAPWSVLGLQHYRKYIENELQKRLLLFKYGSAAPQPYQLINIDPVDVEYIIRPKYNTPTWGRVGANVLGGAWDRPPEERDDGRELLSFEEYWLYQFIHNEFGPGEHRDWQSYPVSRDRLEYQYEKFDELYEAINEDGYKLQRDLSDYYRWPIPAVHDEVGIAIGRNGEMIFNDCGHHRLILAKVMDIESISVRVFVRHKKWQQVRTDVAAGKFDTSAASVDVDHPDLQDVLCDTA